jgi:hypothetical protein
MSVHNRLNEILSAYWKNLSGERPYPRENDVDPDALGDIWQSCFLIQVLPEGREPRYRYASMGSELIEAFGGDYSQQEISEALMGEHNPPFLKKLSEVARSGAPVSEENEFTNRHQMQIRYRTCLLPLGNPPDVEYILGSMRWKAY